MGYERNFWLHLTLLKLIIIKKSQKASKILFNVKQNNSSVKIQQVLFLENTFRDAAWSMLSHMHKWKM